jgi:hypothetical protein
MMDSGNRTPGEGIHAALGLDSALYEESFNKLYSEVRLHFNAFLLRDFSTSVLGNWYSFFCTFSVFV